MEDKKEVNLKDLVKIKSDYVEQLETYGDTFRPRIHPTDADWEAYNIIHNHVMKLMYLINQILNGSCTIKCGSLCCHFHEKEHSVPVDINIIDDVDVLLESMEEEFDDFMHMRRFSEVPEDISDDIQVEEFVFTLYGVRFIYEVLAHGEKLGEDKTASMPKMWDGNTMWVDKDCVPCAFLCEDKTCLLYRHGIRPNYCRTFICSVSAATKLITYYGFMDASLISKLGFPRLNELSRDFLNFLDSSEYKDLEVSYQNSFLSLIESYIKNEPVEDVLREFKSKQDDYYRLRRQIFNKIISPQALDFLKQPPS
jgi:Fe-S-cluster containining protein